MHSYGVQCGCLFIPGYIAWSWVYSNDGTKLTKDWGNPSGRIRHHTVLLTIILCTLNK